MTTNYTIRAGETLRLQLVRVSGDLSIVQSIASVMKKAGPKGSVPPASTPAVATFQIETKADGWDLVIPASVTEDLEPGYYVADAELQLVGGGDIMQTEYVTIEIKQSVT